MALFVGNDLYLNATADFEDNTTPYISLLSQILSIVLVLVLFLMLAIETHPCKVGLVKVSAARASALCNVKSSPLARLLARSRPAPCSHARARCPGVLAVHARRVDVDRRVPRGDGSRDNLPDTPSSCCGGESGHDLARPPHLLRDLWAAEGRRCVLLRGRD